MIDQYNEFVKLYLEMQFKVHKLETIYQFPSQKLFKSDDAVLEYCEKVLCPNDHKCQFKIVGEFQVTSDEFKIEYLDTVEYLYHYITVSPNTLKKLFDSHYEFAQKQAKFAKGIIINCEKEPTDHTTSHMNYLLR